MALGVVEIGGHGDDGLGDLLTEVGLGVGLELAEDHGGDLLGGELLGLVADLHLDGGVAVFAGHNLVGEILRLFADLGELAADQALGRKDGVLRVGHGLALGGLADDALTGFRESDHRRGGAGTFSVRDNNRLPAFHDGHAGVSGSKINS